MDNFSAMSTSHDNRLERAEMDRLDALDQQHETDIASARMEIDAVLDQLKVDLEECYPEKFMARKLMETAAPNSLMGAMNRLKAMCDNINS